ncbi:hypothetical protein SY94_4634 [Agrobacterium tumefaciens]|nr:hypothetical protein SY94_4634 [Agrobacterium tumefaciens]
MECIIEHEAPAFSETINGAIIFDRAVYEKS